MSIDISVLILGIINLIGVAFMAALRFYVVKVDTHQETRHRENLERMSRIEAKVDSASTIQAKLDIAMEEIRQLREWRYGLEERLAAAPHNRRSSDR